MGIIKPNGTIALNKGQLRFFTAPEALFWARGGVGSGKTACGSLWALHQILKYPRTVGLIAANTYKQLTKSTLPPFFQLASEMGFHYVYNKKPPKNWPKFKDWPDYEGVWTAHNGGQILIYTMENWPAIRGVELAWGWLDETADTEPDGIKTVFERLRAAGGQLYPNYKYQIRITGTPNGYDHLYDWFEGAKKLKDSAHIRLRTRDNQKNLPDDYETELRDRLGERLAKQQLDAEFISLTSGKAFDFERERNVCELEYDPKLPLIWSMDFNVAPMAGLVMQKDGNTLYVLDEVCIPDNAQTSEAVNEFARLWKGDQLTEDGKSKRAVMAWGDMAGAHRDTRGSESDLDIMMDTLREHFHVARDWHDMAQRLIIDSVNSTNALLHPANKKEPRLFIDPRCEKLIMDLEQVCWKPGTKELDKSGKNKMLTHFADALKQVCGQLFPIKDHKPTWEGPGF